MIDRSINLAEKKKTALDIIQREGPSLPSAISGRIGIPLLLMSALLSEMRGDKTVKLSNLKIGGSPLYYIEGQEAMLDNFMRYLELKEQEAFELLKKSEVVDEEKTQPAFRVAFRSMKDFAVPVTVKLENGEKVFWKFHTTSDEIVNQKITELLKTKEIKLEMEKAKEIEKPAEKAIEKQAELKTEKPEKKKYEKKPKDNEKVKAKISEWLAKKGFAMENELDEENNCIVSINSQVGKLHFLAATRLKKSLSEADLSLAYQQGQQAKMPVLFLTNGILTKKAQAYLEQLGKLIVVEKI